MLSSAFLRPRSLQKNEPSASLSDKSPAAFYFSPQALGPNLILYHTMP